MSAVYVEVMDRSERFVLERSAQKSLSMTAQECAEEMLLLIVQALAMVQLLRIAWENVAEMR